MVDENLHVDLFLTLDQTSSHPYLCAHPPSVLTVISSPWTPPFSLSTDQPDPHISSLWPGYHAQILRIVDSFPLSSHHSVLLQIPKCWLFTIARTWTQPRCSQKDEWIKKIWYIYMMEYYSAINRNTSESVLVGWMNLEPVIQTEVNQKDKNKYCILTHKYGI